MVAGREGVKGGGGKEEEGGGGTGYECCTIRGAGKRDFLKAEKEFQN